MPTDPRRSSVTCGFWPVLIDPADVFKEKKIESQCLGGCGRDQQFKAAFLGSESEANVSHTDLILKTGRGGE